MSIIPLGWLYKIVRKYTKPIHPAKALVWKTRLSYAYAFLAWNTLGFICYGVYQGKFRNEESVFSPGQQWARTLGIKGAEVYRFSGFKLQRIHDVDTDETEDKLKE